MITVRCILCKDVIKFPKYDKSFLFEHIKQKHLKIPSIPTKIEEKSSENVENPEVNKLARAKPFIGKLSKCLLCHTLSIDKNLGKNIIITDETGRKLIERKYRKNLKLNKSGIQITCPKCGEKSTPIIRSYRKLGTSSLDLICFYSCWPICFFPFILKPTQKLKYCSNMNCGHCFGSFYPSREVIDECKNYVQNKKDS